MLREQITEALKAAMRNRDPATVSTMRLIIATLKDKDIAARPAGKRDGIADDEILAMMQGMIKQRRELITLYRQGNREDLAGKEEAEITIIERFLPKQMNAAEIEAVVDAAITETAATSIKDMGRVMSVLKTRHAGEMDFAAAGLAVKAKLG